MEKWIYHDYKILQTMATLGVSYFFMQLTGNLIGNLLNLEILRCTIFVRRSRALVVSMSRTFGCPASQETGAFIYNVFKEKQTQSVRAPYTRACVYVVCIYNRTYVSQTGSSRQLSSDITEWRRGPRLCNSKVPALLYVSHRGYAVPYEGAYR